MVERSSTALVLLAAGDSRRMGQPKQLLPLQGRPLLRYIVDAANCPAVSPFVVVLGARAERVRDCLIGSPVQIVVNQAWAEGMGSSIRAGMKAVRALAPQAKGVIIALADQPNFSAESIRRLLLEKMQSGRSIVATDHQGALTPPVYFGSPYFQELSAIKGSAGAHALLDKYRHDLAAGQFGDMVDLDTWADYSRFRDRTLRPTVMR